MLFTSWSFFATLALTAFTTLWPAAWISSRIASARLLNAAIALSTVSNVSSVWGRSVSWRSSTLARSFSLRCSTRSAMRATGVWPACFPMAVQCPQTFTRQDTQWKTSGCLWSGQRDGVDRCRLAWVSPESQRSESAVMLWPLFVSMWGAMCSVQYAAWQVAHHAVASLSPPSSSQAWHLGSSPVVDFVRSFTSPSAPSSGIGQTLRHKGQRTVHWPVRALALPSDSEEELVRTRWSTQPRQKEWRQVSSRGSLMLSRHTPHVVELSCGDTVLSTLAMAIFDFALCPTATANAGLKSECDLLLWCVTARLMIIDGFGPVSMVGSVQPRRRPNGVGPELDLTRCVPAATAWAACTNACASFALLHCCVHREEPFSGTCYSLNTCTRSKDCTWQLVNWFLTPCTC